MNLYAAYGHTITFDANENTINVININSQTELYTDLSLLTCDKKIGTDAVNFFMNMGIINR